MQQNQMRSGPAVRTNGQEVSGAAEGVLELHPKGYGFLRDIKRDYAAQETDPFVSSSLIEKYQLRPGVLIHGDVGPRHQFARSRVCGSIESVDGRTLEEYRQDQAFRRD